MKKWKVLLSVLCAVFASVGLFACKGGDDSDANKPNDGDDPGVQEPVISAEDIDRVTSVSGLNSLKYTDAKTWDDILADLKSKARLECRTGNRETITVLGADCDFESTIEFDENGHCKVGSYTVKAKPKEHNPKNAVSAAKDIEITHDFGEADANGVQTCSYDFATRTYAEESSIIHYGTFHTGTNANVPADVRNYKLVDGELVEGADGTTGAVFTNNNKGRTYIKDFGNVTVSGKSVKVPTLTVGQLEPGMTITVKGKAQTSWEKWKYAEVKEWFFPVIGIADKYNNAPVWDGKVTETGSYTGGTSVFVRSEGWVLYNGVGSAADNDRPLAALGAQSNGTFIDGTSTNRNYGSHSNAELGEDEKRPASFTPGQIPSVSDWADWVVYSSGNTSQTSDSYSSLADIELTWNYRQDGIIELIYIVNGSKLTCMIKVPDSSTGYYDTILHGDYVDMWIESYERIETLTPTNFSASVKQDNQYYEGQMFDPATISAYFNYKQISGAQPQALTLENIYATKATGVTLEPITDPKNPSDEFITTPSNWISLATNSVSQDYTYYMVKISKGGETWYAVFSADQIHVIDNRIEAVYGSDALGVKNNNTVGNLTISTDGSKITLTPVGNVYAQAITDNTLDWVVGDGIDAVGANHRYVALAIKGSDFGDITSINVPYLYDKTNGYLVLALTADTKVVTVEGLNAVTTVFDFSAAKGFTLKSTITLDNGATSWYLNNDENKVTVTFTPNSGESLGWIYVGSEMFLDPQQVVDAIGDNTLIGCSLLTGTAYNSTTGELTIVAQFPAANIMNYAARSIRVNDFEYTIHYQPQFAANNTVDEGYYTFVSNGKIYLAKVATDITADNALTLNLNEGNDNILLLNLAYTYNAATGSVALKDAGLEGVEISVKEVAGKNVVLIEIDPSANGINGTEYGYQLKAGASYSTSYFAVSGNTVEKKTVALTLSEIINEGSCLEKGLAGYINKDGDVAFIATPTEFAGSHSGTGTCSYCGATSDRLKGGTSIAYTLNDGQYYELDDAFHTGLAAKLTEVYHGLNVKVNVGSDFYWLRQDGFAAKNGYGATEIITDENFETSFGTDTGLRTPIGKIDDQGNIISETNYLAVLANGAAFRIYTSYQDGTFTLVWRIYRAGTTTKVTDYSATPYFEFWHKISGLEADSVSVVIGVDGIARNDIGDTGDKNGYVWKFSPAQIDKNMIANVEDIVENSNVALEVGGLVNHFATVTAMGGNATAITDAVKEELGITGNSYDKYVKLSITLDKAYTTGNAVAKVYDAATMQLREGAKAEFDTAKKVITVTIALGANDAPSTYYIDLKNDTAHNLQNDIMLDLSAVSMKTTKGAVDTDSTTAAVIKGGNLVINYTGLDDIADLKVKLGNSEAVEPAATFTVGGLEAEWVRTGSTGTLTIKVAPQSNIASVPEYVVSLLDGDTTAVTNRYTLGLPSASGNLVLKEGVYGLAEGDKMYLYLFGENSTGKNYLVFNANNAATVTNARATLLPYSLAYSLNGNNVVLKTTNDFTKTALTATHVEGGSFKVTQFVIDLSYFAIEENAQYYFYVLTSDTEAVEGYSVAETTRVISDDGVEIEDLDFAEAAEISCTSLGSKGYAIKSGETVLGFIGLEAVPSHTWGTNAADATLFECTVCGAILKNNNAKGTLIPAAQFGADKFNVTDGFTISYFQNSANSDWDSIVARTKYGAVNIDSPNLQTNVMTSVDGDAATLKTKLAGENVFPSTAGAVLEAGYAWDTIKNTTNCYITVTVKKGVGIVFYLNGNKMLTYPANMQFGGSEGTVDDFIELFGLCAAREGMYVATTQFAGAIDAVDALVQKGALTDEQAAARYQLYLQERDMLKELVAHTHAYTNSDHTCSCGALDPLYDYPTYSTTNTFDVGVAAANEAKTLAWVNCIQKGEKFVFTGTHKSNSDDNWAGINVSLGSYKEVDSITVRVDRWADGAVEDQNDNGGKVSVENWTFTKTNTSFSDWAGVHRNARKDGNVTVTIDWTTETQIAVTIALEKGGTETAFTYTFTATTGALRDRYNFALGCGLSYSSLTVTQAPTRSDAPTAVTPATPEE